MIAVPPWTFAIAGAVLSIGATIITDIVLRRLSRQIDNADRNVNEAEDHIAFALQYEGYARAKFALAQTLLAIANSRTAGLSSKAELGEAAQSIIGGIVDRSSAATGSPPSEDQKARLVALRDRAEAGDPSAFAELSEISADYLPKVVDFNNAQVGVRDAARRTRRLLDRKAERIRYLAVALQILGVIVILMKDILADAVH
jgi:hypothetical protein